MQKITPCLWFDKEAKEAVNYYTSIFKNSKILKTSYYGKEGYEVHKMPEGTVLTIEFQLDGQNFMALNGGPVFKFNEALSLVIHCDTQEEVDHYWNKLSEGGDENAQACGWLKDKYGLSWQVVPSILAKLMTDPDHSKTERVMKALLQMKKLEIAGLKKAYEG